MLDELVKTNSTLTTSITQLTGTNTWLTKEVASLAQEVNKYKKGWQENKGRRGNPTKHCPNCKRDTWYEQDDCFESEENSHNSHPRWIPCVKIQCGSNRLSVEVYFNNCINRSHLKLPSCRSALNILTLHIDQLSLHKNKLQTSQALN